jgi:GT2 family glycosyltransferase
MSIAKTSPADVSIVIVNWNGGEMLLDCLASIPKAEQGMSLQVIVVDNASSDGSREAAERMFPQFQIVNSGANLGFGKANNLARPLAHSDLILFLNPDTLLFENSIKPMVDFIRLNPDVGAVGCKMRFPNGEVHEQGLQFIPSPWTELLNLLFVSTKTRRIFANWLPILDPNKSAYVLKLYGGCLLCRRNVLDAIGWFDERYFMYAEDVDLCTAIMRQKARLYYLSTAEIIHIAGGSTKKAPSGFAVLMKAESISKFMIKHHGKLGGIAYRLEVLVSATLRLTVKVLYQSARTLTGKGKKGDLKGSLFKHWTLILWALGLRKPLVSS